MSAMLQLEGNSLRRNGEAIGGIENRLGSAQDRLSEVNGSCSSASSPERLGKHTVNKAKSSLVQASSQGVRVNESAGMSVLIRFVWRQDVLGVGDRIMNGGNTIKFLNNLEIYPSAPYALRCGRLAGGGTVGNGGFSFKGGHHLVFWL